MSNNNSLDLFLNAVIEEPQEVKFVASKRILNPQTKEPLEWTLKPLVEADYKALRDQTREECTKKTHQGQVYFQDKKFVDLFNRRLAVRCTVMPDLDNAQLQDKHGAVDGEELLGKMLSLQGEYDSYLQKAQEINGYEPYKGLMTEEEMRETAKNE